MQSMCSANSVVSLTKSISSQYDSTFTDHFPGTANLTVKRAGVTLLPQVAQAGHSICKLLHTLESLESLETIHERFSCVSCVWAPHEIIITGFIRKPSKRLTDWVLLSSCCPLMEGTLCERRGMAAGKHS